MLLIALVGQHQRNSSLGGPLLKGVSPSVHVVAVRVDNERNVLLDRTGKVGLSVKVGHHAHHVLAQTRPDGAVGGHKHGSFSPCLIHVLDFNARTDQDNLLRLHQCGSNDLHRLGPSRCRPAESLGGGVVIASLAQLSGADPVGFVCPAKMRPHIVLDGHHRRGGGGGPHEATDGA